MAEAVIISIAGDIISNLLAQALKKVGNLCGVKQEIEMLRDRVSRLRAVLDHAEEQYYHSPEIQVWLEKLKNAFYDAHDVLEELNIEALQRELRGHNEVIKEVRTFFSSSNQLAFNLKMSYKVRVVRERIEAIKADRGLHLEERPVYSRVEGQWRKGEETHSYISEGDMKGRDDDKRTIIKILLDPNMEENVSIVPIVGIGGLGKTALAQCVYNDEMINKHFDLNMWVCVSNDFEVKKIVTNIITCAKKKEPSEVAMEQLQIELREEIHGKRYLLVLDDLWNEELEKWLSLRKLLMGGARGSKILITTRLPSVAKITGNTPPHFLGGLSESASIDLLMQMAGRKLEEMQDFDMLAIIKEIVRKCSGVPLVIRTVGGLLSFKESKHEWLPFKENELAYVSQREDNIKSVFKLSYDHLPSHLKQCFALCSLFPKDYEINKQTLVNLWMAEGFIQPSHRNQHLEDIAHRCFVDLLWSNFFQDFKKDPNTDEETCKMHDLMHDLACLVAGIECWVAWDDRKSIPERARYISHNTSSNLMGKLPISRLKARAPRTIISTIEYREIGRESMSEADLRELIQSFKRLRILDLHAMNVEKVPRSIYKALAKNCCELEELKGLNNIRGSLSIENLQSVIDAEAEYEAANLIGKHSLESLALDWGRFDADDVVIGNKDEVLLDGLRPHSNLHKLTVYGYKGKRFPRWMTDGSSFPNLAGFSLYGGERYKHFPQLGLNKLKTLSLWRMEFLECLPEECLKSLTSFESLDIRHCPRLTSLSQGMRHLSNLVDLTIISCGELDISKDESGNIIILDDSHGGGGLLHSLRSVDIRYLPKLESLPHWLLQLNNLEHLQIWSCINLKELPKQMGALQSLQWLEIIRCPSLTSLPEGMRRLVSLTHLHIERCPELELDISKDERGNILDFHGGGLLHSLRSVDINYLPKLESLPQWLPQLSNLERLHISFCLNLKELPEQMEALQSLERLEIEWCPLLTSLPEGMRRLASLTHLIIHNCPELEARCKRDAGEDWHKIAHIPNIYSY
ncbi:putative disease resistance protein RGA4 [Rhodamnia argentea]|uniref:Disease resistance protein RGA4 n=1 Tax=Rhodamnia argentea TaxID=178133 RepID=A0ABM3HH17_9MYRT|nr:putative disease resistance protein RGA4 [Rhodamnia argentea]